MTTRLASSLGEGEYLSVESEQEDDYLIPLQVHWHDHTFDDDDDEFKKQIIGGFITLMIVMITFMIMMIVMMIFTTKMFYVTYKGFRREIVLTRVLLVVYEYHPQQRHYQ